MKSCQLPSICLNCDFFFVKFLILIVSIVSPSCALRVRMPIFSNLKFDFDQKLVVKNHFCSIDWFSTNFLVLFPTKYCFKDQFFAIWNDWLNRLKNWFLGPIFIENWLIRKKKLASPLERWEWSALPQFLSYIFPLFHQNNVLGVINLFICIADEFPILENIKSQRPCCSVQRSGYGIPLKSFQKL